MTAPTLVARQVTDAWANHGEGPIWDVPAGVLRYVDLFQGDVLSWRPGDGAADRWHVGDVAAAIRRRRSGGFVVAAERGFSLLSADGCVLEVLPPLFDDLSLRMNDGACDPQGRFFCGSMDYEFTPALGGIYRLDPDHGATRVLDGVTIPNGMAFSDDGGHVFHIDTPTQCLMRYTVGADGGLQEPVQVLEIAAEHGEPDGMAVDAEGGFWIAMWDGAAVRHYSPQGQLREVIALPVSRPTACTFGGADARDLYITSSSVGIDTEREPAAGAVFVVRTSVPGRAEELYAG